MTKLDKAVEAERQRLLGLLEDAQAEVETAVEQANNGIAAARNRIEDAVERYNEAIVEVEALRGDAQQQVQGYYDDRSEPWREGDKGQEYQAWIDAFDQLEIEEVEVDLPDPVEMPEFGTKDDLEQNWPGELPA